jgi:hypothetical protein
MTRESGCGSLTIMTSLEDIEKAVTELPADQLARFRAWLEEFEAARFDQRIEQAAKVGRLDQLASILLSVTALFFASVLFVGEASAQLPEAIVAPGETMVVTLHAQGAQVYECKAGADGKLAWAFREPIATLILAGKTVGRHYAGPNWDHIDGSGVTGRVVGNAPGKTMNDIAWLKLQVTAHRGSGILAGVTTIQRINTAGGTMIGTCGEAGAFHSHPYATDYVFLRKGS